MRAKPLLAISAVLASAAAGVGLRRAFRRDMAETVARLDRGSALAATAAGPIEYAREGRGPALLVSHGAGGGYDQALAVGRELGAGYDLIAPSRFGYLRTPRPQAFAPNAQADAHVALLDRLRIDKAIVVGVSAGAPSAIDMALAHPDRVAALVLLVPRAYAPAHVAAAEDTARNRAVMAMIMGGADFAYWLALKLARRAIVRFLGVPPRVARAADRAEGERLDQIMRDILPLSRRLDGLRYDGETPIAAWPLERITAPTFVMSAEDDLFGTLAAARFTAMHVAGAELMVAESGGHLMIGRMAQVRERVADFLDRRLAVPIRDAA